jgi:hypothetical protein
VIRRVAKAIKYAEFKNRRIGLLRGGLFIRNTLTQVMKVIVSGHKKPYERCFLVSVLKLGPSIKVS